MTYQTEAKPGIIVVDPARTLRPPYDGERLSDGDGGAIAQRAADEVPLDFDHAMVHPNDDDKSS